MSGPLKRPPLPQPPVQKLPVDQPESKSSRLGFVRAPPRQIHPPIPIQHDRGESRFYECSNCGFVASRMRSNWKSHQPCLIQKANYSHCLPTDPLKSVFYDVLVQNLQYEKTPISELEIKVLKAKYKSFLAQYRYIRSFPPEVRAKQMDIFKKNNEALANQVRSSNQTLNELLLQNRQLTLALKNQGYEVPSVTLEREESVNEIIKLALPTFELHLKGLLNRHFYDKRSISVEMKSVALKQMQQSIYKIDISDIYLSWAVDVSTALALKLKRVQNIGNAQTRKKEQKRQTRAANFLKRINYSVLRNKRMFIEILREKSKKLQKTTISFLNFMRQQQFEAPQISNKIVKSQAKKIKRNVSIDVIRKKVLELKSNNELQLACDLYFALCMSVRLNDLTRIFIEREGRSSFYDYVSILQNKNKHDAVRVVPVALKKLVHLSKNTYPITKQRLQALKQYCYSEFQGFYLLRSSSITAVLSGLMKASNFNPHHVSTTTLRYYVNYEDYDLMNSIFNLPIQNVPQIFWKRTYKRLYIGQVGDPWKQLSCDKDNIFQAELTFPSTQVPRQQQALDMLHQKCILDSKVQKYESKAIQFTQSKSDLANFLLNQLDSSYLELLMFSNFSFLKLLASMINRFLIAIYQGKEVFFHSSIDYLRKAEHQATMVLEAIQTDTCLDSVPQSQKLSSSKISLQMENFQRQYEQMLNPSTYYEGFPSILKNSSSKASSSDKKSPDMVVLVEGKRQFEQFAILKNANQDHYFQANIRKSQRLLKLQHLDKIILKKSQSCKLKCRRDLDTVSCFNCSRMITVCQCSPDNLQCECERNSLGFQKQFISSSYISNTTYGIIDQKYKHLQIDKNSPNNLKKEVQNTQRTYLHKMASSLSLDSKVFLPWQIVTKQIYQNIKLVQENSDFLPLKIVSISSEKGKGIRATEDIQKGTIIGLYFGVIRSSREANPQDDSLVSIGWFNRLEYFICCNEASNYGRFFNGSQTKDDANILLKLAFVQKIGFCPYFITKEKVYKEEQLQWYYGKNYEFSD